MSNQFRTAAQVRELRYRLGSRWRPVTQSEFALRLGVSRRTVIRWEQKGLSWAANYDKIMSFRFLLDQADEKRPIDVTSAGS